MIKLYLGRDNREVDIDQSTIFSFDYSSTDHETPTKTKTTFSKTITLKGTPTNNAIFGQIWNLERAQMVEEGADNIGIYYDPKKRADFTLTKDGDIVEQGYISLDEINVKGENITYSITLYGGLGNFFYNLAYNEEMELNLSNLYWGFTIEDGTTLTKEEEDNKPLLVWDRKYIISSWDRLSSTPKEYRGNNYILDVVTPTPTYSDLYSDFDSNKVLYKMGANPTVDNILNSEVCVDGYTNYNGYLMMETTRNLSEWEIKDLRSQYQRPSIKFSNLIETICNPINNGGYTVEIDEDITNTPYYKDSYILLDRLNFDNDLSANESIEIVYKDSGIISEAETQEIPNFQTTDGLIKLGQFNTSNMINPKARLSIGYEVLAEEVDNTANNNLSGLKTITTHKAAFISYDYHTNYKWSVIGGVVTKVAIFVNGSFYGFADDKAQFTSFNDNPNAAKELLVDGKVGGVSEYQGYRHCENLGNKLGITFSENTVNISTLSLVNKNIRVGNYCTFATTDTVKLKEFNLPKASNVELYLFRTYVQSDGSPRYYWYHPIAPTDNDFFYYPLDPNVTFAFDGLQVNDKHNFIWANSNPTDLSHIPYKPITYSLKSEDRDIDNFFSGEYEAYSNLTKISFGTVNDPSNNFFSAVYDNTNNNVQPTVVNKKILLGGTKSPYDYLISFTKALNLKYEYDNISKTVHIMQMGNYYQDSIIDLTDKIDISKGMTINPTTTNNKWYEYGFNIPTTYAASLYNNKNKIEYGHNKINTNYYFNNSTKNLFGDNIYNGVIPYRLNSIMFNQIPISGSIYIPHEFIAPTVNFTAYKQVGLSSSEIESQTKTIRGYQTRYTPVKNTFDQVPKICAFDKDNNSMGGVKDALVFYDGSIIDVEGIKISDNFPLMYELNEKPCYIGANMVSGETWDIAHSIPKFSTYKTTDNKITDSLDYKRPTALFAYNELEYLEGTTIYNRYWSNYINDIYDRDSKRVTVNAYLDEVPQIALKKFYFFSNSLWILSEIKDYQVNNTLQSVRCTFVKVKNKNNYLQTYNN